MTESQQKIEMRRSKVRERLGEIGKLAGDEYSDEIKAEERGLQDEYTGLEQRHRTAIVAEDRDLDARRAEAGEAGRGDARARWSFAARHGSRNSCSRRLAGGSPAVPRRSCRRRPESPAFRSNCGTCRNRSSGPAAEQRAVTPAPGTVGINLDPIRPAVFANSIAPRLGIEMPRVMSGTFASGHDHRLAVRRGAGEIRARRSVRSVRSPSRPPARSESVLGWS